MARYDAGQHNMPDNDYGANQVEPDNDAYWASPGYDEGPVDWDDEVAEDSEDED